MLAATPIGQVGDAPPRLAQVLATADVIAAEDTRRLRRLLADLGVSPQGKVVSYFEGNEASRTPELVTSLESGSTIVLVSARGSRGECADSGHGDPWAVSGPHCASHLWVAG